MNQPHDPVLPQLGVALDPSAMAEAFADVLRPHGVQVEACRIERVKYRPGRNASVGYRLSLRDGGWHAFEQHVAARLCGQGAAPRSVPGSMAATGRSAAGPALHWLPALDMLTWWWPNDPKLRAPRMLTDEATVRGELVPALLCALGADAASTVDACDMDFVQYVPELRLCARLDLRWRTGAGVQSRRVYGKASREHGATGQELLAQLQQSAAWRAGRLHTPRALLWHAPSETGWQEGLPGQPLLDLPPGLQAACAAPLGEQLATLHGTPAASAREITAAGLHERLSEVVRVLSPLLGGPALENAAQALQAHWPQATLAAPPSTLHGDLHGRNILVEELRSGPRVALVDLDGLSRGPAVLELGAWMADAIYLALLEGAPAERGMQARRTLVDAYVAAGGSRPDPAALRWATAWNLLTQRAWRCVVNLKPGRYQLAPRLVELAADMAGGREAAELAC